MTDLGGALPALVTPLTAEGELAGEDVDALVARALADGASGVLVAGSTGEGALLDPEQRAELTRRARAATDAAREPGGTTRATVLAGATGATVADLDADVARLAEAGADAVLVLAPGLYPLTPEELVVLHVGIADRADVPTLVYHLPQYTGSWLTADAVGELAGHPGIVGMKDSSPDADRRAAFITAARHATDFAVLTGSAPTLRAALEAGADGSITAIANVHLRRVTALHAAVAAHDDATAETVQTALTRASEALDAVGASPAAALKAALQLDGTIAERWCRPPLHSVPPGRLDHVRTALLR